MKVKFGDVLYIKGRIGWQLLKKNEYLTQGDYYLVTGVDITDTHRIDFDKCYYVSKERYEKDDKIQLEAGDIIVTKDGTIGKIGIIDKLDKPATLNSHLFLIRNKASDILDTGYLFQILRSDLFQKFASNNTSGSNIPAFTQANISNFEIELPSLNIQRNISVILENIDNKIRNNNKINAELESMAKTLYDYWFLQFEFPNVEGNPYKSSGGKMVWNEELKSNIPEGWTVENIGDIIIEADKSKIQVNGANSKGKFPFFTSGESILAYDEYFVNGFNLFLNTGGNPDIKAYYGKCAYSTDTWCISAREYSYILYYYLLKFLPQFEQLFFAGSGLKHLQKDAFKNKYMLIPDIKVLKSFNEINTSIWKKTTNQLSENQELKSLRDFLLPLLMNGQVTFK